MKAPEDRRPRLSTLEVAEITGVSRATLARWVKEGKIPEPARDPNNGWPVWQQAELDAIAKLTKTRKRNV